MRIGIFTNNYRPITSGLTASIENFRKGLEALGHEVYIFAPRFKGYKDREGRVFRYPSSPFSYKARYPLALPTLKDQRYFASAKIDIVHAQHPWAVGRYGLKLARKFKVPVVFTNHTVYSAYIDYIPHFLPRKLILPLIKRSAVGFANRTDAVIVPTESTKGYLAKQGVRKPIHVVPSGVEQQKLQQTPLPNLRKRYNIPKEHKLILNLSRIGPEKNLPLILKAYKKILEKNPKTILVMAGGGFYLDTLKHVARRMSLESKVIFTGPVEMDKRGGYFREGDIFIHSSLSETQGLVLVESMAVGVPVVAVKANAVVDIVKDGQNGLITNNTAESLAEGVLKLLENSKLRTKLKEGALKTANEYSVENTSKSLEALYKKLINPS